MKKLVALFLVLAMSAVSMCACSLQVNTGSSSQSSSSSELSSSSSQPTETPASSSESSSTSSSNSSTTTGSSADLFSFTIKFDGNEYTIPCDYSEFADNGWKLRDGEDETLKSKTYTLTAYLKKGDTSTLVQLWNPTDSAKKFSECKVGMIKLAVENGESYELPGGFVFDSSVTVDDIKKMYGEPDSSNKGDDYETLRYKEAVYQDVEFVIYSDEKMTKNNYVEFQNFI